MRILALITDALGCNGGIARYNGDLFRALSQSPIVSEIVVLPRFASKSVVLPSKVCQLEASGKRAAWAVRALALAARQRFDAVFCGHLNAAPIAHPIARLLKAPLWVQVHGIEAWRPRGRLYRQGLSAAKLITSVSRYTRRMLLTWADVPPSRIRLLPAAISSAHGPGERRHDLIERYALHGKRVVLTVGRLSAKERYKGHDRIISAMPEIVARVPNAAYLIVGSGDDAARLDALARQCQVRDRVVFAGQVPDGELADHFALADAFAMPSTGEGFGIVFLEAAASGLPVIAGNRDGSTDALADGYLGRLIDPMSSAEIASAIAEALEGTRLVERPHIQRFAFANFAQHVDELVQVLAH